MAAYDYLYFNFRFPWGKLKLANCRGVGFGSPEGCSLGEPAVRDGGGAGFLSYQRVPPTPRPPWYSISA